jgi:GT2 family glycosyltransferase
MNYSNQILISLLTYNSKASILNCLKSLENQTNKNFKCFIFDNASTDGIENEIKKFKDIEFIQTGENLGYTGGHNFAFNFFRENYPNHQFMMILNPDTLLSQNLLEEYQNLFTEDKILYTCLVKNEYLGENNYVGNFIQLPSFTFIGKILPKSYLSKDFIYNPFVSGCCFIVNFQKIRGANLFKDYFMYHEEIELSIRNRMEGNLIPTVTKSFVVHSVKKDISNLPYKIIYLLELNRLKLQSDLFHDFFILMNLPFYLLSRIGILLIFKPKYMYKPYLHGILDGLKYWIKNLGKNRKNFRKSVKFLFIDNYFHKF